MTDKVPLLTAETADWCETMLRNKSTVRDDSFNGSRVQAELIAVRERRAIVVPADAVPVPGAVWDQRFGSVSLTRHYEGRERLYRHPPADHIGGVNKMVSADAVRELVEAADALLNRWDFPHWLDIRRLRAAVAKHRGQS